MAHCSHCGVRLADGATTCAACGTTRIAVTWADASELCECGEPTSRGWRFCVACGRPTTVVEQGRSVRVDPARVRAWFADLLPTTAEQPSSPQVDDITDADEHVDDDDQTDEEEPRPVTRPVVHSRYTSAALAAGSAQRALLGAALAALLAASVLWVLNARLAEFVDGVPGAFDGALAAARLADWGTRPLTIVGIVLSVWYLMRWTTIAYDNIPSFGPTHLRFPPSIVPWAFFVPGLNFVAPRRLINDSWRAATTQPHGGRDWMLQPGNRWTSAAWLAGGAGAAFHAVAWRIGSDTVGDAIRSNRWAMLGYVAAAGAALTAVMMVQRVTDRQEQTHAERTDQPRTTVGSV